MADSIKGNTPPAGSDFCATIAISMASTQFDICDLTFTFELEIYHEYSSEHAFTVEFTCPDFYFSYLDNGALQNVSYSNPGAGLTTISGTVVSDPNGDPFPSRHIITLSRNASWSGLLKYFTVSVYDPECSEPLVEEESFNLSTTTFVDLRPYSETSLAELVQYQRILD